MTGVNQDFHIPKDGQTYISEIVDRSTSLIDYGVWGGLHISQLRRWLANFKTVEEKYFAACVLDSLIYRSKDQTIALMRQLFQRTLTDLSRFHPSPIGRLDDCLLNLQGSSDPGIRLVPAVKSDDPLTKSAHIIARYMKQQLSIREDWIIKPSEIDAHAKAGIKVFIFIDDFLGTGDQFEALLHNENLAKGFLKNFYTVYSPLVSHEKGQKHLHARFPDLVVTSVESLDDTYGLFHPQSPCFNDSTNTPECTRAFYYNLLKIKGIKITGPERR